MVSDFKRMESSKKKKVYHRVKNGAEKAEAVIVDLSLKTMTVEDAAEAAGWAIEEGLINRGKVIILDWDGNETLV